MKQILAIILLLVSVKSESQTHRIDSLRKILPYVTGTAKVKSYNQLCTEFYFFWVHSDSALKYSTLGFKEAVSINDIAGQAQAMLLEGGVKARLLGQPIESEQISKSVISLIKDLDDDRIQSIAWYYLGLAQTLQGKHQPAAEAFFKCKQFAVAAKDTLTLGWAEQGIGFMYFKSGQYWKSFEPLIKAQDLGKLCNDSVLISLSLAIIARTYNLAGDPQGALRYYHQCFQYGIPFIYLWSHVEDMAYSHLQLGQYDSAQYYQDLNTAKLESMTADEKVRKKFLAFSRGYSIDIQLARKEYDLLLQQALPDVKRLRHTHDVVPYMQMLFVVGKAYEGKRNYTESLRYTRELYNAAIIFGNKRLLTNANELLSSLFFQLKQGDSAYYYYRQFVQLRDSAQTAQYAGRTALYLAASEAQNEIRLLSKDKELSAQQLELNKKELQKESQLKNMLIAGLIILALFSSLIVRNIALKRKSERFRNEREQSQLKQKAAELEMQALRAQMNPHFIFNCLSAIDNLIQTNQPDKATTCLSRFAKLIRGVLESSKNNMVPFQKDFETLQLYLEMEQFRCNNKFNYELNADPELLDSDYHVPPMIVQPFIENAIHHGLLNKQDSNRKLKIEARLHEDVIIYSIRDNGIGRKKARQIKEMNRPGQASYGIAITKERIQLHNRNGIEEDLCISDLEAGGVPAGTEAVIRIHCTH